MILLLVAACLDRVFESPYILVSGLGETRSLTIDMGGDLLAATPGGLWRVGADGTMAQLDPTEVRATTLNPAHLFRLVGDRIVWEGGGADAAGVVDICATWFEELWVLHADRIVALDPSFTSRDVARGLTGGRALALGPEQQMLVVTATGLLALDHGGKQTMLASGLRDPRAAGADPRGRIYVVDGDALYRIDPAGPTLIARFLEDVRDLQFGAGPKLRGDFVYLATGNGRVDYVQVPP